MSYEAGAGRGGGGVQGRTDSSQHGTHAENMRKIRPACAFRGGTVRLCAGLDRPGRVYVLSFI